MTTLPIQTSKRKEPAARFGDEYSWLMENRRNALYMPGLSLSPNSPAEAVGKPAKDHAGAAVDIIVLYLGVPTPKTSSARRVATRQATRVAARTA